MRGCDMAVDMFVCHNGLLILMCGINKYKHRHDDSTNSGTTVLCSDIYIAAN